MATRALPEEPNLGQLRNQARELQRGVRTGDVRAMRRAGLAAADPHFALHSAQLTLARGYGFPSWDRLRRHVQAINARTWSYTEANASATPVERLLRLCCVHYAETDIDLDVNQAVEVLAEHPAIVDDSLAVAAVVGEASAVRRHLARRPAAASQATGPYGWSPLMYLTYSRYPIAADAVIAVVDNLLEAGADPNDGRFFAGLPTPFTVLTGVFGSGENDPAPHRHERMLARRLLNAGADANDGQTLYNRMFGSSDSFLEVLFEHGLGRGDGGPWRRLLPDVLPGPDAIADGLVRWAVSHDQRARIRLLAQHGVDLDHCGADGIRAIDLAHRTGHPAMVRLLRSLGVAAVDGDAVDDFVAAALAGDAAAVRATPAATVAAARRRQPGLMVWAAGLQRPAAVALLVEAGFDVDALARGDLLLEQPWQTALHTAVERDDETLVRQLLALGADRTVRDRRFDNTPAQWAEHFGQPRLAALLAIDQV